MYKVNARRIGVMLFRSAVALLAATTFTFLVIGGFYYTRDASYWFGYDKEQGLIVPPVQAQGDDTPVRSRFYVARANTTLNYSDRAECRWPDGTIDKTYQQKDSHHFSKRVFGGYPLHEIPDGFEESERSPGRHQWDYSWRVNDIPPVGSKCRIEARPYVVPFFGLFSRFAPTVHSNWFEIIRPTEMISR